MASPSPSAPDHVTHHDKVQEHFTQVVHQTTTVPPPNSLLWSKVEEQWYADEEAPSADAEAVDGEVVAPPPGWSGPAFQPPAPTPDAGPLAVAAERVRQAAVTLRGCRDAADDERLQAVGEHLQGLVHCLHVLQLASREAICDILASMPIVTFTAGEMVLKGREPYANALLLVVRGQLHAQKAPEPEEEEAPIGAIQPLIAMLGAGGGGPTPKQKGLSRWKSVRQSVRSTRKSAANSDAAAATSRISQMSRRESITRWKQYVALAMTSRHDSMAGEGEPASPELAGQARSPSPHQSEPSAAAAAAAAAMTPTARKEAMWNAVKYAKAVHGAAAQWKGFLGRDRLSDHPASSEDGTAATGGGGGMSVAQRMMAAARGRRGPGSPPRSASPAYQDPLLAARTASPGWQDPRLAARTPPPQEDVLSAGQYLGEAALTVHRLKNAAQLVCPLQAHAGKEGVQVAVLRQESFMLAMLRLTTRKCFQRIPELAQLPSPITASLLASIQYEEFEPGDTLFREGDLSDSFYVVLSGEVNVLKPPAADMPSSSSPTSPSGSGAGASSAGKEAGGAGKARAKKVPAVGLMSQEVQVLAEAARKVRPLGAMARALRADQGGAEFRDEDDVAGLSPAEAREKLLDTASSTAGGRSKEDEDDDDEDEDEDEAADEEADPEGLVPVARLGPGTSFGEIGMLRGDPRTATCKARKWLQVGCVSRAAYLAAQQEYMAQLQTEGAAGPSSASISLDGELLDIVRKRSGERTEQDIVTLSLFLARLPFFSKLSNNLCQYLARTLKYETFAPRAVLFKQGDEGDCLYIIMSGSIQLTITYEDSSGAHEEKIALPPGAQFGELAIISNAPRGATATATEPTGCIKVDRRTYNKTLKQEHMVKMSSLAAKLQPCPMLALVPSSMLLKLAFYVQEHDCPSQAVLMMQGDRATSLCILGAGECRAIVHPALPAQPAAPTAAAARTAPVAVHPRPTPAAQPAKKSHPSTSPAPAGAPAGASAGGAGPSPKGRPDPQRELGLITRESRTRKLVLGAVTVSLLCAGECFGEHSVLTGHRLTYSVLSTSACKYYSIGQSALVGILPAKLRKELVALALHRIARFHERAQRGRGAQHRVHSTALPTPDRRTLERSIELFQPHADGSEALISPATAAPAAAPVMTQPPPPVMLPIHSPTRSARAQRAMAAAGAEAHTGGASPSRWIPVRGSAADARRGEEAAVEAAAGVGRPPSTPEGERVQRGLLPPGSTFDPRMARDDLGRLLTHPAPTPAAASPEAAIVDSLLVGNDRHVHSLGREGEGGTGSEEAEDRAAAEQASGEAAGGGASVWASEEAGDAGEAGHSGLLPPRAISVDFSDRHPSPSSSTQSPTFSPGSTLNKNWPIKEPRPRHSQPHSSSHAPIKNAEVRRIIEMYSRPADAHPLLAPDLMIPLTPPSRQARRRAGHPAVGERPPAGAPPRTATNALLRGSGDAPAPIEQGATFITTTKLETPARPPPRIATPESIVRIRQHQAHVEQKRIETEQRRVAEEKQRIRDAFLWMEEEERREREREAERRRQEEEDERRRQEEEKRRAKEEEERLEEERQAAEREKQLAEAKEKKKLMRKLRRQGISVEGMDDDKASLKRSSLSMMRAMHRLSNPFLQFFQSEEDVAQLQALNDVMVREHADEEAPDSTTPEKAEEPSDSTATTDVPGKPAAAPVQPDSSLASLPSEPSAADPAPHAEPGRPGEAERDPAAGDEAAGGRAAGPAHAQAGPEHAEAGPEHAEAGPEHAEAGPEHAEAGPEHAEAGPEHAEAGPEHAEAGPEHTASSAETVEQGGALAHREAEGAASTTLLKAPAMAGPSPSFDGVPPKARRSSLLDRPLDTPMEDDEGEEEEEEESEQIESADEQEQAETEEEQEQEDKATKEEEPEEKDGHESYTSGQDGPETSAKERGRGEGLRVEVGGEEGEAGPASRGRASPRFRDEEEAGGGGGGYEPFLPVISAGSSPAASPSRARAGYLGGGSSGFPNIPLQDPRKVKESALKTSDRTLPKRIRYSSLTYTRPLLPSSVISSIAAGQLPPHLLNEAIEQASAASVPASNLSTPQHGSRSQSVSPGAHTSRSLRLRHMPGTPMHESGLEHPALSTPRQSKTPQESRWHASNPYKILDQVLQGRDPSEPAPPRSATVSPIHPQSRASTLYSPRYDSELMSPAHSPRMWSPDKGRPRSTTPGLLLGDSGEDARWHAGRAGSRGSTAESPRAGFKALSLPSFHARPRIRALQDSAPESARGLPKMRSSSTHSTWQVPSHISSLNDKTDATWQSATAVAGFQT